MNCVSRLNDLGSTRPTRRRPGRSGFTLIEMVFTSFIMLFTVIVGLSVFLMGVQTWYKGEAGLETQTGAQQGIQRTASLLRQAIYVSVDANGQGLTFNLPEFDGTGTIVTPMTWDGIARRIEISGDKLIYTWDGGPIQTLCDNVVTTDPLSAGGTGSYVVFTPGPGTITRSVSIMIVSQQGVSTQQKPIYGRRRETIYLRNVPGLVP